MKFSRTNRRYRRRLKTRLINEHRRGGPNAPAHRVTTRDTWEETDDGNSFRLKVILFVACPRCPKGTPSGFGALEILS